MASFDGILEFLTVSETQSFSAASRQLHVSTSHISRQVAKLEQHLGCALFVRTTRKVSLTDSGSRYYQQCKQLYTGLQQANEQLMQAQIALEGTLRVSAAGTFAEEFVTPALIDFANTHPALSIDIDFNSRKVNFVEDGIDFAIRYGQLSDSGLVARKLTDRAMMAAASPAYLAKFGTPNTPQQLMQHSCLVANNSHWQFKHAQGTQTINVKGRWRSNQAAAVIKACEQGLGIAYMPKSNFNLSLEKGTLEPVLKGFWAEGASSWIVYENKRFLPMRARLAIDYLLQHFSDWQE